MANCADSAREPEQSRLAEIACILAAGILRLRRQRTLPVSADSENPDDSLLRRLEVSGETVLSVHTG
jgi:hypothetical protein